MAIRENAGVRISQDSDGKFTAYSETESVFCFVRDTHEEATAVAQDTVADYERRFGPVSSAR